MNKLIIVVPALLVVGCATTGGQEYAKVYDRKSNTYSYVAKQADSEFVGTAATAPKAKPAWWSRGHP